MLSAFIAERKEPITIFMIGDSTMANKSLKNGNIERGWGQMLPGYFTEEVVVDNHAMNGRSSLSFINEGRWDIVLSKIHKGDYLFNSDIMMRNLEPHYIQSPEVPLMII